MKIKDLLKEYHIRPNKRLGQNFLIDNNIKDNIINAVGLNKNEVVLEIGPGLGALTEDLCKCAKKVIAIEKDRLLYKYLLKNIAYKNLELIHGDILKYNFKQGDNHNLKVVGNLPYYISSPILTYLIDNRTSVDSIFITVQKEFAQRLVASPGTKDYGSITCFVNFYTEPSILFTIKSRSFYPVPEVDSCFMKISFRKEPLYLTDEEKLFKIIRASFGKRRKTILNSLSSSAIFSSKEEVLQKLKDSGISPKRRPEELTLKEFAALVNST